MSATLTTNMPLVTPAKGWNIALWILQVGVAGMFTMAGVMKVATPIDQLAATMPWAADAEALIRFIGISEILGGVGLILPSLLRIRPSLTVTAAWSLAFVMRVRRQIQRSRNINSEQSRVSRIWLYG